MIRVFIADDHAVIRTGLQLMFDATPDIELVGEMSTTYGLLEAVRQGGFDLLILDVALPGHDPLDLLKDLKRVAPALPVIVFSMYAEERYAQRFLASGAAAYLNKERPAEQLIEAIRAAIRGEHFLPPGQRSPGIAAAAVESLTDREFQILRLLAEGTPKDQIAEKLSISKHTISNHRNRILKKLQLANNAELTRYALQQGVIQ